MQSGFVCFYIKDRDSVGHCLRENDAIPTLKEREKLKEGLSKVKNRKLILKIDQPTWYWLIDKFLWLVL